ncbi:tRNA (guanine(10)-N2)-methyltransferase [Galdieria sulphuraria]|uniref:Methyltransferase/ nucleic acid binding protein n=1 Tax=Galdieria sulphuraria TaxID=130081 RepID=M2X5H9_GALSU|nr:methyltransferase/ nucleic acid binding protein [Galdieria sulphuraria]EME31745.1 methyltransferase/ nucleic acid binding protein [Galdieria sulphuraria]GJD10544.1 tRNA (guanine(10)-N2)-methyltransferase [Galdieria sulphuraria]|eukprot:XP_005708265.1 methyltransferase/ nucleic acid binding protein [Galdieria sulphuraria]
MHKYLVIFRDIHKEFSVPELLSVYSLVIRRQKDIVKPKLQEDFFAKTIRSASCDLETDTKKIRGVFYFANFQSDQEAFLVGSRCVLVRAIIRLWSHARSHELCLKQLQSLGKDVFKELLLSEKESFRCRLFSYGRKYSQSETVNRINFYSSILQQFPGKVNLQNFKHEIWIVEDSFPKAGHTNEPSRIDIPNHVYAGLLIAEGCVKQVQKYTLKKRNFIGTTSMDAELAFIMANFALADNLKLILDPFVGTASILISSAAFGAETLGSDLSFTVLKGKNKEENIVSNFRQYKLQQPLGIVRCDILHNPWRHESIMSSFTSFKCHGWLDAIVADLPYGVRESSREFVGEKLHSRFVLNHIPKTSRVGLDNLVSSLFDFATSSLVGGGRLVFWLPCTDEFSERDKTEICHPSFISIAACRQILTCRFHRVLFVFERKAWEDDKLYDSDMSGAFLHQGPFYKDFAAKLFREEKRTEDALWRKGQWHRIE